ncbi:MAG: hypothetical protein AAFZ15_05470 [Bacteroidota bacterium]
MNYKFLAKNGLTLAIVLGLVGVLATLLPVFGGLEAFNELADSLGDNVNELSKSKQSGIFQYGIYVSMVFGAIAFGLAVLLGIIGTFTNIKASKTALIAFAVLAVLFIVLNATASTDMTERMQTAVNNPEYGVNGDLGIYKMISAGISGTLILLGVAFASMILMEIWNFFKNS